MTTSAGQRTWKDYATELEASLNQVIARNEELSDEIQRRKDNLQEWQRAVAERDARTHQLKADLAAADTRVGELEETNDWLNTVDSWRHTRLSWLYKEIMCAISLVDADREKRMICFRRIADRLRKERFPARAVRPK